MGKYWVKPGVGWGSGWLQRLGRWKSNSWPRPLFEFRWKPGGRPWCKQIFSNWGRTRQSQFLVFVSWSRFFLPQRWKGGREAYGGEWLYLIAFWSRHRHREGIFGKYPQSFPRQTLSHTLADQSPEERSLLLFPRPPSGPRVLSWPTG